MSIEKIEAFVGHCDNCGELFDDGEYSIFAEEPQVEERMNNSGWYTTGDDPDHEGKYYCPSCFKYHEEIDDKIIVDETRKKSTP